MVLFCMGIIHPLMYGTLAAFTAELFPANIRYSATALGYQLGGLFGGGFAPLIFASLLAIDPQSYILLSGYLLFGCAVTIVCIVLATRRRGQFERISINEVTA
jgi:Flp pilus assembly protein protease CpaA